MTSAVAPCHFDRSKPFYPLVIGYVAMYHGLIELMSRAVVRRLKRLPQAEVELQPNFETLRPLYSGGVTELIGELAFRSKAVGANVEVDIEEIAVEIVNNRRYLFPFFSQFARHLLILAWETTQRYHDSEPLWELLRHCRNAAAHNGRFALSPGEPKNRAAWRSIVLTNEIDGTLLFDEPPDVGLFSLGDPLRLLWDIEQAYRFDA